VDDTYKGWLAEGFARRTRAMPETFEIATNCSVVVTDEPNETVQSMKGMLGFYIGGMGAKDMNFHKEVFARMGYATEVQEVQDLFFAGERDKAIAAVPDSLVTDISIIGTKEQIRDDIARWEEAGVTMLVVGAQSLDQLRTTAEAVLG
jgi:alkanesulfonate monooxygenase SsuD/methylene tetrahydromethanopterin reductase-like flavin-dependent oxidoreductase (luciferase family)